MDRPSRTPDREARRRLERLRRLAWLWFRLRSRSGGMTAETRVVGIAVVPYDDDMPRPPVSAGALRGLHPHVSGLRRVAGDGDSVPAGFTAVIVEPLGLLVGAAGRERIVPAAHHSSDDLSDVGSAVGDDGRATRMPPVRSSVSGVATRVTGIFGDQSCRCTDHIADQSQTCWVNPSQRIVPAVPVPVPSVLGGVPREEPARAGVVVPVPQELQPRVPILLVPVRPREPERTLGRSA